MMSSCNPPGSTGVHICDPDEGRYWIPGANAPGPAVAASASGALPYSLWKVVIFSPVRTGWLVAGTVRVEYSARSPRILFAKTGRVSRLCVVEMM